MEVLNFNDVNLRVIDSDGAMWVSSVDIAKALGYTDSRQIAHVYARHTLEFTANMTRIFEVSSSTTSANLVSSARYFSLRGAHLIAMFARTRKAQAFRVWVLDILENKQSTKSLLQEYYEACAEQVAEKRFASLCGKGLSQWRKIAPVLNEKTQHLMAKLQPSLLS